MTKTNKLNVSVGDIVELNFPHYPNAAPFSATVTQVEERYGSDLIVFVPTVTEENKDFLQEFGGNFCDVYYVTKVIKRSTIKKNYVKKWCTENPYKNYITSSKFLYHGRLDSVVNYILHESNNLQYGPKEYVEIYTEWRRAHRPGLTRHTDTFNKKHLKNWVLNNKKALTRTRTEWLKIEKEHDDSMDESFFDDIVNDNDYFSYDY